MCAAIPFCVLASPQVVMVLSPSMNESFSAGIGTGDQRS
jgi:hypothetical protein